MRIICPSCAAEYEVPASRLTPGKMARCVRCGGEWMAVREPAEDPVQADPPAADPQDDHAEEPAALPSVTAMDRLAHSPAPSQPKAGLIGAWVLTAVVLVGATAAAIAWRQDVVHIWPPSSRILGPIEHMMGKP